LGDVDRKLLYKEYGFSESENEDPNGGAISGEDIRSARASKDSNTQNRQQNTYKSNFTAATISAGGGENVSVKSPIAV
jgi:hypothetical protein